jgi:hypothetical protein
MRKEVRIAEKRVRKVMEKFEKNMVAATEGLGHWAETDPMDEDEDGD